MKNIVIPSKGFTHAGKFHTDDVFCTAFFELINPKFQVERGFQVPKDFDGIVYDIGLGPFDHHGEQEYRANGVPYAAFGKVWRHFAPAFFEQEEVDSFDRDFVQYLDKRDTTGCPDTLCMAIVGFNHTWNEKSSQSGFREAVDISKILLSRLLKNLKAKADAKELVKQFPVEDGILMLQRYLPWQESALKMQNVVFAVSRGQRGGYTLQTVQEIADDGSRTNRISFPVEWLGKRAEELETMQHGLEFCHVDNWLLNARTLEDAKACAKAAVIREREINPDNPWLKLFD